ncbi:MAG: hypothetical protein M3Q14_03335 [bacterium]|nr:hypothetical protein [bacterium]
MHTPEIDRFEANGLQFVRDAALEDIRQHEKGVHGVFEELTQKHLVVYEGLLSLLPYDPEKYPAQRLDVVEVRSPVRAGQALLEEFATSAYPGFGKIKKRYLSDEHSGSFDTIILDLEEGRDYVFAFDHERIMNTPLGKVATLGAIEHHAQAAKKPVPEFMARLTASKILSRVEALGMNVIELLALFGAADMSIPNTESTEAAGISPLVRRRVNAGVKATRLAHKVENPDLPVVDSISASASTDVLTYRFMRPHAVHMQPMSSGTAEMLTRARILPAAVNVNKPYPKVKIGRILNPAKDNLEAHGVMVYLAQLAEEATGRPHIYHSTKESFKRATGTRRRG